MSDFLTGGNISLSPTRNTIAVYYTKFRAICKSQAYWPSILFSLHPRKLLETLTGFPKARYNAATCRIRFWIHILHHIHTMLQVRKVGGKTEEKKEKILQTEFELAFRLLSTLLARGFKKKVSEKNFHIHLVNGVFLNIRDKTWTNQAHNHYREGNCTISKAKVPLASAFWADSFPDSLSVIESIPAHFAWAYKNGGSWLVQTCYILHVVTCVISNVRNSSTTQNIYCGQYQPVPDRLLMRKSCRPKDWPFLFSSNKRAHFASKYSSFITYIAEICFFSLFITWQCCRMLTNC